jgi:hypothetical protein
MELKKMTECNYVTGTVMEPKMLGHAAASRTDKIH